MISASGCRDFLRQDPDPWLDFYTARQEIQEHKQSTAAPVKTYSFSAQEMSLPLFIRWFSDKTGAGVVYANEADNFRITCEFKNNTPDEIMNMISRRFDFELVKQNNAYYLGKLKPEDRGMYVKKIKGYSQEEITAAITVFLSEFGKCYVQKDGVVVVSDREKVLGKVIEMLNLLESSTENSWIIQYYFVVLSNDLLLQGGANVVTSGEIAYKYNKDGGLTTDIKDVGQNITINFNLKSSLVDVQSTPMFIIRDGTESSWQDGQSVPIPQKTVSSYGVVTTTGFQYIDTGIVVKTKLRETNSGAILTVDLSDTSITGYNEYQPILKKSALKTESMISSGSVYLLGEFCKYDNTKKLSQVLDLEGETQKQKLQLFCRAYKINRYLPQKDDKAEQNVCDAIEHR